MACLEGGAVLEHWPDSSTLAKGLPETSPSFLLAVPRVFEKVFNSAQQQAAASGAKSKIFRAAADTAIAYSRAQATPGPGQDGRDSGAGPALKAPARALRPARIRQAAGRGRRQGSVRDLGRRSARRAARPLLPRRGHHGAGGLRADRDLGRRGREPAEPQQDRHGRPSRSPASSVRIADDGEILIAGPIVFRGYWRNEAATAEVLDADGWLHTGDIGALDDEGFLSVTGRKKELIVTAGGKNVAPAVLEDRLRAHPLISQTMVVGDNRPFIACLITLDTEALEYWKQQHGKPADATRWRPGRRP